MRQTPQTYTTSTLANALSLGCDCVQRKYDGQWVRCEISEGMVRVYDAKGLAVDTPLQYLNNVPLAVCGTFIGNLLLDHSRIVLWDCWALCDKGADELRTTYVDTELLSYRNRYALLVNQARVLVTGDVPFSLIQNFSIRAAKEVWQEALPHVCGVVFRDSQAKVGGTVLVARKYREAPTDLA